MRLYKCPICDAGRKAPDALHPEDARRFCLDCTAKTGRLVRVVAPAVETAKAAAKAARERAAQERRERAELREWERRHTWPGIREVRWKKLAARVPRLPNKGAMPVVRDRTKVVDHYAELVRLGCPRLPTSGDTGPSVKARRMFFRRVGVDDALIDNVVHGGNDAAFWKLMDQVRERAIDWLLEDLGFLAGTAHDAVRGVAERADLSNPDDVKSLNNVILAGYDLAKRAAESPEVADPFDDACAGCGYAREHCECPEPIGGWQGA